MSEKEMANVIKEYLKEVKSKLPDWLKDKKEHKEILAELEEHIWNKAEELSETSQLTVESVRIAISHMGTPESIAKEYKRRGTPKVYITEEMWPLYLKVLGVVFAVIIGISIISQVIDFIFGNVDIGEFFLNIIQGIQTGILISFAIITIIFVVLSMEGYFPEDFKSKKIRKKEKQEGEIIGGAFAIVVGVLFLIQPIPAITSLIALEFLLYLQFAGLFILTEGILDLSRGLIGNRQMIAHQIIHGITIAVKLASISVVILMMNRPEIFPIIIVEEPGEELINIGIAPEYYTLFRGIAGLIIALVALSTIEDFYKIYKAERYKSKY